MKKIFAIGILMSAMLWGSLVANAATYYVDGKSASGDGSQEKPFSTIQAAANIVEPGDTVLIEPGIYYEQVDVKRCGTKDKPIVFRATSTGKNDVIISGANREIREGKVKWTLEDEENNIWSIPYNQKVSRMLYNGNWMDNVTSLEILKTLRANGYVFPEDIFTYSEEDKKLYIRLRKDEKYGSSDPNKNMMCVSAPYYTSITINGKTDGSWRTNGIGEGSYCFGVVTEAPAHIAIYGLTFECPGEAGVYVRGSNVRVSNCWFVGCSTGVHGGGRSMRDIYFSNDVTIEHCDWNLFPVFENAVEILTEHLDEYNAGGSGLTTYYYWHNKSNSGSTHTIESGGIFGRAGNNWTLRNCHITSCFDALSFFHGMTGYIEYPGTNKLVSGKNYHYYENRFEEGFDNAIEFEDTSTDYNVHHNEFLNNYTVISWQSAAKPYPSNIKLHHNQFEEEQWLTDLRNATSAGSTWLKIGCAIDYSKPYYKETQEYDNTNGVAIKPAQIRDQGFALYNNSVYMPQAYSTGIVANNVPKQMYYYNNIIYCRMQSNPRWKRLFIRPGTFLAPHEGDVKEGNMFIPSNPDDSEQEVGAYEYNKGFFFKTLEDAKVKWDEEILTLEEGSVGIDKGVQVPWEEETINYIGAVPYGKTWHIDYGVYPYGDTNCDNKVDVSDLSKIAELKGAKDGEEEYRNRCDMNFDSVIDEKDITVWLDATAKGGAAE